MRRRHGRRQQAAVATPERSGRGLLLPRPEEDVWWPRLLVFVLPRRRRHHHLKARCSCTRFSRGKRTREEGASRPRRTRRAFRRGQRCRSPRPSVAPSTPVWSGLLPSRTSGSFAAPAGTATSPGRCERSTPSGLGWSRPSGATNCAVALLPWWWLSCCWRRPGWFEARAGGTRSVAPCLLLVTGSWSCWAVRVAWKKLADPTFDRVSIDQIQTHNAEVVKQACVWEPPPCPGGVTTRHESHASIVHVRGSRLSSWDA
jgi:hypothetical protein